MAEPSQVAQVETWQVLALAATVLIAVLTAYGTLILSNRAHVNTLWQRLLGADSDETDEGFIPNTNERITELESQVETHAETTHQQLYKLDRKLDTVVDLVADEHDVDVPNEYEDSQVPPPPQNDFYRDGGSPDDD